jgi:type IV secretion system protein VirB10
MMKEIETENEIDRGIPSIAKKTGPSSLVQKMILVLGSILVIVALIAVNGGFDKEEKKNHAVARTGITNHLGPAPTMLPKQKTPAPEQVKLENEQTFKTRRNKTASGNERSAEITPEQRKNNSGLLVFGNKQMSGTSEGNDMTVLPEAQTENASNSLASELTYNKEKAVSAWVLADRSYYITKGTFLDCALETAISSDVPGMVSCRVTRDIYGTDNKILLLDRGSRITGQYKAGVQQGISRIFVIWSRVETPNGVMINLDSPGTDALGRSGHSGYIDTHFFTRFGSAIMFSLIDDIGAYASAKASSGDNIQFGTTTSAASDVAAIALENSINIGPTLYKNQGDQINVFVARDLDFRGVYDFEISE